MQRPRIIPLRSWWRWAILGTATAAGAMAGAALAPDPPGGTAMARRLAGFAQAEQAATAVHQAMTTTIASALAIAAAVGQPPEAAAAADMAGEGVRTLDLGPAGTGILSVTRQARPSAPGGEPAAVALRVQPSSTPGANPTLILEDHRPVQGGSAGWVVAVSLPLHLPASPDGGAGTGLAGAEGFLPLSRPALMRRVAAWLHGPAEATLQQARGHAHIAAETGTDGLAVAWAPIEGTPLAAVGAVAVAPPAWAGLRSSLAMLLGATTGAMAATLARSIARRRRLEAALARTRREHDAAIRTLSERQGLETLGRLTAGVAHDMGNVMQAVEFYLSAIPDSVDDREALTRLIARARGAARRGATGARDLLALARGSGGRPEPIELARLLTELAEVMQELLGEPYRVRLDLPPTLPPVLAEAGDLEAMLVNLATNSRDAMASAGTGVLTIRAALVGVPDAPGDAPNNTPNDVPGGEWVRIDITDTGVGMDAETLARSMEPFFTTKPRGRGTGLGLALAREFADRSGGLLQIESMPGSGTRASLFLHPATDAKVNDDAESSTDTLRSRSPWVGSGSPRTAEARP